MSRLIVIEGPDRVGKATQAQMLKDYLEGIGRTATVVEVPIKGNFTYRLIYWMLRNGMAKQFPVLFQVLQCLNRWAFQTFYLVTLEHDYDYIIFDRWSLSTSIYGAAEGLKSSMTDCLYRALRRPDFTLLLLGPAHEHEAEDAYEKDVNLQTHVRDLYTLWSYGNRDCHVVDPNRDRSKVHQEIVTVLKTTRNIPV